LPIAAKVLYVNDMRARNKLIAIKLIHTIIWIFFNAVLLNIAYAVIVNRIDKFVWIGIGCIVVEFLVLLTFKMACPLTILARNYSDSTRDNFDIYIPNWLARYNKQIYTAFFIIVTAGVLFRVLKR